MSSKQLLSSAYCFRFNGYHLLALYLQTRFDQLTREANETHAELNRCEKQQKELARLKEEVREALSAGEPELLTRKEAAVDASRKFKAGLLGKRIKDEPAADSPQTQDELSSSSGPPRRKARKSRSNANADAPDDSQSDPFPKPPEDLPNDARPDRLQRDLIDFEARLDNEEQLYAYSYYL